MDGGYGYYGYVLFILLVWECRLILLCEDDDTVRELIAMYGKMQPHYDQEGMFVLNDCVVKLEGHVLT